MFALFTLSACTIDPAARAPKAPWAGDPYLMRWMSVGGGSLASAADATGTPSLVGRGAFQRLVHPVDAAGVGNDLYIADAGVGRVFRYDLALQAMVALPGIAVHPGTRLAAGSDHSVFVLDPQSRRVVQFSRDGRLVANFRDESNLPNPVALGLDEARGLVLVADGTLNHIVAFHPLGGAFSLIQPRPDERDRLFSIAAIAAGNDAIYASDAVCRCITRLSREGALLGTFAHQQLAQPSAIAVDRFGRVYVADRFSRSVKVFMAGKLVLELPPAALGMSEVTQLSLSREWLALIDGPGARIELLRPVPPKAQ